MAELQQTTVRLNKQMARTLGIHKVLTGESGNALLLRLLEEYFAGEGAKRLAAAGYDQANGVFNKTAIETMAADRQEESK